MVRQIRRVVTIVLGLCFLALGVISGFLPFIQGWIFVLIGLMLLAKEIPFVHHKLEQLKARFPKQAAQLHRISAGFAHQWHRLKTRFVPERAATTGAGKKPNSFPS
jgi:uncharacterized membrane protein YbaN (DUF454 family)